MKDILNTMVEEMNLEIQQTWSVEYSELISKMKSIQGLEQEINSSVNASLNMSICDLKAESDKLQSELATLETEISKAEEDEDYDLAEQKQAEQKTKEEWLAELNEQMKAGQQNLSLKLDEEIKWIESKTVEVKTEIDDFKDYLESELTDTNDEEIFDKDAVSNIFS